MRSSISSTLLALTLAVVSLAGNPLVGAHAARAQDAAPVAETEKVSPDASDSQGGNPAVRVAPEADASTLRVNKEGIEQIAMNESLQSDAGDSASQLAVLAVDPASSQDAGLVLGSPVIESESVVADKRASPRRQKARRGRFRLSVAANTFRSEAVAFFRTAFGF